ncbi:MAG: AAA family ATPase [Flavobacteriales bacterium CG_4_10_14_0_2_um_filter_32_8]|nr:MAG: AAA family ATPase [Flavobacteriales bacterium CG_4_10_14_0_2_um_filter_32_8]
MFLRKQILQDSSHESLFLWGARQTGKSTLLKQLFPDAIWFDLLLSDVYERLLRNPALMRETVLANTEVPTVIIDEIQRIPELLNEIHWLITNTNAQFIMSGSSPRKIIRSGANLLGGRALRYELYPLISQEIPDFDLLRALNHGLLPRHYLAAQPKKLISAYIGNYLREEIVNEAKIRNVGVFSQFLEAAAFSNGEMVNYTNIASDCGVSAPTIKEYFQILQDTLIGRFVPSYQKKPKRRVILTPKFYFFDIGIVNHLLKRGKIEMGSEIFGNAFEHFIYHEIYAHSSYSGLEYPISYWRTTSQLEVDFVLGNHEVAIEVKSSNKISERHLNGLKSFSEEYKVKHLVLVCNESLPRLHNNIWILPWQIFLQKLWDGEFIS